MATASPSPQKDADRIFELFRLPETSTYSDVHSAYVTFLQEYVQERELAKKLKPLERRTHKFTKTGEQFKEVSAAFLSHFETHRGKSTNPLHGLEHYSVKHNTSCLTVHIPSESIASWKSVCEAYYGKDDAEVLKLREDNERLRRRVQQLEDTIASLQSTSTATKKEMDDMKLSQDVLKVRITNVKGQLVTVRNSAQRKTDVQKNDESVANRSADPVLEYFLPTRNRFEALSQQGSGEDMTPQTTQASHPTNSNEANTQEAPVPRRIVLIGDSNAQKLKPSLLCPTADMPRPYWSPNLFTAPTVLEDISKDGTPPHTVILHQVTNDIMSKTKETVISELEITVSASQSLFPKAEVVISAIPQRRDSKCRPGVNEDISSVNLHIQNMCEANEQLTFVSHPQLWTDNNYNAQVYESDGYHLSGDGVRVIAFNLKNQASKALGLSSDKRQGKSPRRPGYRNNKNSQTKGGIPGETLSTDKEVAPGQTSLETCIPKNRDHLTLHPGSGTRQDRYEKTRGQQWGTFRPGIPSPPNSHRDSPPPTMLEGRPPPAPPMFRPNRETPPVQWFREWPSPAEAYSAPPNNVGRPGWFGPPPYPFFNMMEGSWFGLNERPRPYGSG
ncbi:hypothetical protein Bbelb_290250 [Branchiostoma belcheri]|nr:hypothetical protein Bbelb_290250 [Branchiostoma belcheri]